MTPRRKLRKLARRANRIEHIKAEPAQRKADIEARLQWLRTYGLRVGK